MANLLKDLRIDEVSSVDRGAGEGVKIMLMKRQFTQAERDAAATSGDALPDGSFPIKNVSDLENAVHAYGRASDKAKAKAHIIRRAQALNATDKLPSDWAISKGVPNMTEEEKKAAEKAAADKAKAEKADIDKAIAEAVTKALPLAVAAALKAAGKKKVPAALQDEDENDDEAAEEATKKGMLTGARALAKMSPTHRQYFDEADFDDSEITKFLSASPQERDQHMAANPDPHASMSPKIKKALDDAASNNVILAKLMEDKEVVTFGKRAVGLGLPETFGEVLRKAYKGDEKAIGSLETMVKGLTAQVETGKLFAEFGAMGGGEVTAKKEMEAKVAELQKANPKLSNEQAFTKVYTDRGNVDLKKRYDAESGKRAA